MALFSGGQSDRILAIFKILPELEEFLSETLANEPLSEEAEAKRGELVSKIESFNKPPDLPPRSSAKSISVLPNDARLHGPLNQHVNISEQRALSWKMSTSPIPPTPAPYQSRKRHTDGDSLAEQQEGRPSWSSISEDTGIYEKIPSESGSGKYIEVKHLESDGKPPVPDRAGRVSTIKSPVEQDALRKSRSHDTREIYTRDLQDPSCCGPLVELREHTKYWYVLKNKQLYIFKDVQGPCSQIVDIGSCEVLSQTDIRISMPGALPLILKAENEEDHQRWSTALERCKYEELDEVMPERYKMNLPNNADVFQDPDYEMPVHVIEKIERMRKGESKSPIEVYVDMQGGRPSKAPDDYVDPLKQTKVYESLENLTYDAELPPIPLSSDEELLGDYGGKFVQNGRIKAQQSDDRGSGPFDASTSSSEDEQEPPALPPRKERSSTEPPPYSINNSYLNSLDRKSTVSLGRKPEREAFYNDAEALHVGVLHQRRVLAVWQKRYCKAKNESLIVYRNPDKDEKPALELNLQGLQFVVCDKETWRSHSFKVTTPSLETYYFAAETHEHLVTWLNVLVKGRDRLRFSVKDGVAVEGGKDSLSPIVTTDANDSGSACSSERRDFEGESYDSGSESIGSADSEASDQDQPENDRRKYLKKRSSFQKSQSQGRLVNQELDIEGTLYVKKSDEWQKFWCRIETTKLNVYASRSSESPEQSITLLGSSVVIPPKSMFDQSPSYVFKISLNDSEILLLAKEQRDWKRWTMHMKKYAANVTENAEIVEHLPALPVRIEGERKQRLIKKPVKNGVATPIDVSDVAQHRTQFTGKLLQLKDINDESGQELFCEIRGGFFALSNESSMENRVSESPVRKVRIDQKATGESNRYVFELQVNNEVPMIFRMKGKSELQQFVETAWLQNANVEGEKSTLVFDLVGQLKTKYNRRSITFDPEPKDLGIGDRSSQQRSSGTILFSNDKAASDSEHIGMAAKKQSKVPVDSKKAYKQSSKHSGGSRMSAFFRSLPRRKHKKYEFTDVPDGIPKMQFSGTVFEVKVNEDGVKTRTERHCKVSGKIFYAYEVGNDLKPVFKVPLRNATIEEGATEKEDTKLMYSLTSMEDKRTFTFEVDTEEEFDNWYNALYMIETKSNAGKMSSRESLLDETKSDVDTDLKVDISTSLFSGSNSNSSLSSVMSKQARSLAGSGDESKAEATPTRKVSEDVFASVAESIRHSGFLFEVKISETNGIKSRTKIRHWCVLRQSWIELFVKKNDKVPLRGISIAHYNIEPTSVEESGEKWAISLRSEEDMLILCASNEEDYVKWQQELKKVTKKRSRRSSDMAKLKLKSASDGIKHLLSSSSLSGLAKRDSKRNTIVLNETDEKLVHDFTVDIESGNKISGILTITVVNEKFVKPKKRFCVIRDGKFCIAKRSKPQKFIRTIDLSKVVLLDECDIDKEVFGFRLNFGPGECMAFQAADQKTADDWMVAISMAILLEKLTSPDKFPQHGEQLDDFPETLDDINPDLNGLGLVDVSPVIANTERGSESSNFSNDIKAAIDHKISVGDDYLSPLSNLLESAFEQGPYSGSSAPSSREGTLERCSNGSRSGRSGGIAIPEEVRENSVVSSASQNSKIDTTRCYANPSDERNNFLDQQHENPRPDSVSRYVAFYESHSSPSRKISEDSVFDNDVDSSQVEVKLADLLKKQEELEKERNVILKRLPDLRNEVSLAQMRIEKEDNINERGVLTEEYQTIKGDLERMEKRLSPLEKELKSVKNTLTKRASKLKDPFRRRSAVISPHIIV